MRQGGPAGLLPRARGPAPGPPRPDGRRGWATEPGDRRGLGDHDPEILGLTLEAVKARRQATWAGGDYSRIAALIPVVSELLAERAGLEAGTRVPDVAGRQRSPARRHTGTHGHRHRKEWVVMCRNIRTLYNFEPPATTAEVQAAALQYVRKISGFTKPSQANADAFERAVAAVAAASMTLLGELSTTAAPKDREVEAAKARARFDRRRAA